MLQAIRDRATGVIAWVIVILITIPFALWGINQYFTGGGQVTVAEVNGTPISQSEFRDAYRDRIQRLSQMYGDDFDPDEVDDAELKRAVLQEMIDREVVRQAADGAGFRITDDQVLQRIHGIQTFQRDGEFSEAAYNNALSRQGMSPVGFEARLRESLLIGQLRSGIDDSAFVTDAAVDALLRIRAQQRELSYLRVAWEAIAEGMEVDQQDIQGYYEEHPRAFMTPERVRIRYLDLSIDSLAKQVEITESALRDLYESDKRRFTVPERRRARHILIEPPEDGGMAAARQRAAELRERIDSGASIEALAKEHSDDAGSAAQGGDLGYIERGTMAEAFEEALFSLEPGEVSAPVRTEFGFHVIKLVDIKPARQKSFEEARAQIERVYRRREAQDRFYEQYDTLANLTYEHPNSLERAAEALGLKVQESSWFTREGGEGIAGHDKVVETAFSPLVLDQGNNSDPVELSTRHVVVLRAAGHEPAQRQALEDVSGQIRERLRRERAQAQARARAQELVRSVREGGDPRALAAEHPAVELVEPGFVERSAQDTPSRVVERAFEVPRPGDGAARVVLAELGSGDSAVVIVSAVRDTDPEQIPSSQRQSLHRSAQRIYASAEVGALVENLRADADITIYRDNL